MKKRMLFIVLSSVLATGYSINGMWAVKGILFNVIQNPTITNMVTGGLIATSANKYAYGKLIEHNTKCIQEQLTTLDKQLDTLEADCKELNNTLTQALGITNQNNDLLTNKEDGLTQKATTIKAGINQAQEKLKNAIQTKNVLLAEVRQLQGLEENNQKAAQKLNKKIESLTKLVRDIIPLQIAGIKEMMKRNHTDLLSLIKDIEASSKGNNLQIIALKTKTEAALQEATKMEEETQANLKKLTTLCNERLTSNYFSNSLHKAVIQQIAEQDKELNNHKASKEEAIQLLSQEKEKHKQSNDKVIELLKTFEKTFASKLQDMDTKAHQKILHNNERLTGIEQNIKTVSKKLKGPEFHNPINSKITSLQSARLLALEQQKLN